LGNTIEKNGLFNITYRLENQSTKDMSSFDNNVSLMGIVLKFDNEDSHFFPKTGSILDLSLETNILSINEYTKFSKIVAFFKTNFNFKNFHTISPSLFLGAADNTLPYPEKFSFGGYNNFCGFRENQEIGRQMFRLSVEYKYELPFYISALSMKSILFFRYDLGSI